MKINKLVGLLALLVILVVGLRGAKSAYQGLPPTYDGSDTDVTALYNAPEHYDVSDPDGVGDIIVQMNLAKTHAVNAVASVVFDFRGFDTMGESFILFTAIGGAIIILSRKSHRDEPEQKEGSQS